MQYYANACNEFAGTHLRVFAPEQHFILNLIVQQKKSWDKKIVVYSSHQNTGLHKSLEFQN